MKELSIMLKEGNDSFRINQYVLKESFGRIEVWEKYYKVDKKIGEFDTIKYGNINITMFSNNNLTSVSFSIENNGNGEDVENIRVFEIINKYPCEVGCKIKAELEPLSFIQCGDETLVPTQIDDRIRIFHYHTFIHESKYVKFGNLYIEFFYCFDEGAWKLTFHMDSLSHLGEKDVYIAE